jgi:TolB-like protein/DNA-binding winged helix-turn-helix (wHTH) protein
MFWNSRVSVSIAAAAASIGWKRRGISLLPAGRTALDILGLLVEHAGEVVESEEIRRIVWRGKTVEDANLATQIFHLRESVGRNRIQTVSGRGYRFVGSVKRLNGDAGSANPETTQNIEPPPSAPTLATKDGETKAVSIGATSTVSKPPAALALPDKPSIAVLPFQNMSGDPEQEYFADGMAEEIVTALSRIRWLFVIARTSSFTYKNQMIDVRRVGHELGVGYVLEGSVRKAGGRVRIAAQLIETQTGAHLWADRFNGSLEDIFELQDQIAVNVAGVIEPALQAAEIRRSTERPTNDLTAYDLYLRSLSLSWEWEKDAVVRSLDLLERAIERDPHYGSALAHAATRLHDLHVNGWTDDPGTSRQRGIDFARRALQIADDDPNVLTEAAYVLGYFGEDIHAAIALVDRALELNPGFARGWQKSGWLRLWTGHPDLAIEHFKTALRLNPREQRANPFMGIGVAHFFARRFEEAKVTLLQSLQEKPSWAPTYRFLASCYAHMGQLDDARVAVTRLRTLTGVVVPSATHWNPEYREFYLSGLRQAADAVK